jgi:hypothetical protein
MRTAARFRIPQHRIWADYCPAWQLRLIDRIVNPPVGNVVPLGS